MYYLDISFIIDYITHINVCVYRLSSYHIWRKWY